MHYIWMYFNSVALHFDALHRNIPHSHALEEWIRIRTSAHQCSASQGTTFESIALHFDALRYILTALNYIFMHSDAKFLITMHQKSGSG